MTGRGDKKSMPSEPPYCYVHIGAPKTGSTFLQRVFFENREALRGHGLLYPDASLRGFGHHDIAFLLSGGYPAWATPQDRPLDEIARGLSAAVANHSGSVLLSSEDFFLFPEPQRLKQFLEATGALAGRQPRIIVYVRRQDDAHEFWYNQCIKAQGETGSTEESIKRYHNLWDYDKQLGLWSAVFGDAAMVVRRYLPPTAKEPSLFDDMVDILRLRGLDLSVPPEEVNVSENRDILRFQLYLNRMPLSPQQKRRFHRDLMVLSRQAKDAGIFDERPLLSARDRAAIMDSYAAGNAAVAKRYFGDDPLFSEARLDTGPEEPFDATSGLTTEKMLYIMGWLLAYRDDGKAR